MSFNRIKQRIVTAVINLYPLAQIYSVRHAHYALISHYLFLIFQTNEERMSSGKREYIQVPRGPPPSIA